MRPPSRRGIKILENINLTTLITRYRQEYDSKHPTQSFFNLQPITKVDIFGQPIQELGSLDQLEEAVDREKNQKDRDAWVFRKILDDTEGQYFQELVAMMGDNYGLKPCDGFLWPQCTYFCDDYPNCDYVKKAQKETEEKKKPKVEDTRKSAGGGSTGSEKAKKKRKKKKK